MSARLKSVSRRYLLLGCLCATVCLCVLYEVSTRRIPFSAFTMLGQLTLQDRGNVTSKQKSPKQPVYLCVNSLGGLGNQMFEFAAMMGTALRFGLTPAVPADGHLKKVFNLSLTALDAETYSKFKHVSRPDIRYSEPVKEHYSTNTTLYGYMQSWKYFRNIEEELRTFLQIRTEIIAQAEASLSKALRAQHGGLPLEGVVYVGIHVRRGDMTRSDKITFGHNVGSKEYILKAMDLFHQRYSSVMFVVCSDDIKWSKEVIPAENATFMTGQEAAVDMATLSLCNHTIMTVGSFGWWSAWLAGGTTVYQRQQVRNGTALERLFDFGDYILPEWISLDESGKPVYPLLP